MHAENLRQEAAPRAAAIEVSDGEVEAAKPYRQKESLAEKTPMPEEDLTSLNIIWKLSVKTPRTTRS